MKDVRDKVIALAIVGGITGGIVSPVLNLKLIGMIISFVLSLVEVAAGFVLSLVGLKVALACIALGLIVAIAINRQISSSPSVKKIIIPPAAICGIILIWYIADFVLKFISSSPLIMGGMIGFTYPALFTILFSVVLLHNSNKENKAFDGIFKNNKTSFIKLGIVTVVGTVVGVSLGAAVSTVFPNVMFGMWSIALASIVIGAIVFPIEIFITAELITLSTTKKLEVFTAFVVNKITKCFSSKENEPSEPLDEAGVLKALEDLPYILPSSSVGNSSEKNKPSKSLDEAEVLDALAKLPCII